MVGRERECAELDRLLDGAREGRSASLVVRGGAGMGKTALLGHVADHAVGMTVLGRLGWLRHVVTALRKAAALTQDTTLGLRILAEAGDMAVYARDYEATIAIGNRPRSSRPARTLIGTSGQRA